MVMNPLQMRLSPSGPVIGNPPVLVGGPSNVAGRVWVAQGAGAAQQVPGTAAGDALGLESVVVNLLPAVAGYKYDLEFETNTFGDLGTNGGYDMIVLGSHDNGATYPDTLASNPDAIIRTGAGRLQVTNVTNPNAVPIDHVKCQLKSIKAAAGGFTYSPTASALRITEISPTT
jgi:hypothetical protein